MTESSYLIEKATGYVLGGKLYYMTAFELYTVLLIIFLCALASAIQILKAVRSKRDKRIEFFESLIYRDVCSKCDKVKIVI